MAGSGRLLTRVRRGPDIYLPRFLRPTSSDAPLISFGGGTFSRASVATWWDGVLLRRYATDVLRQVGTINGRRAFALEGARTNYVLHSNDHDNAAWAVSSATVSANEPGDPSGGAQADAVAYDASVGGQLSQTAIAVPVSVNAIASRFLKQKAAFADDTIQLSEIDHVGGISNNSFESTLAWQRQIANFGNTGTPDTGGYSLRHRNGIAEARSLHVFGSQLEVGAFATSLIETGAAAATRAADSLMVAGAGNLMAGDFVFWCQPRFSAAEQSASGVEAVLLSPLPGSYIRMNRSGGIVRYQARDGSDLLSTALLNHSRDDIIRVEWRGSTSTLSVFNETTALSVSASNLACAFPASGDLHIGRRSDNVDYFHGRITELYPL